MKITEIPQEASLTLRISRDEQLFELSVEIYKVLDKGIVLFPIVVGGKVLNLGNSSAKLKLICERSEQKPLIWGDITYGMVKQDGYPCLVLADPKDGVEFNRRGMFRMPMDVQGLLNGQEEVIVHDISGTGISFYTSRDNEKEVGERVTLRFQGGYEQLSVAAKIVRKQENEDRVLHGCAMNSTKEVDKFLSEEQARRINRRRR